MLHVRRGERVRKKRAIDLLRAPVKLCNKLLAVKKDSATYMVNFTKYGPAICYEHEIIPPVFHEEKHEICSSTVINSYLVVIIIICGSLHRRSAAGPRRRRT